MLLGAFANLRKATINFVTYVRPSVRLFAWYNSAVNLPEFHPSCGNRVVPCGRTDGRTDRKADMTKIMVAFRNFANAPRNKELSWLDRKHHLQIVHLICGPEVTRITVKTLKALQIIHSRRLTYNFRHSILFNPSIINFKPNIQVNFDFN